MRVSAEKALAFVREHGVVLASARGKAPRLVDFIAGQEIEANWWGHPRGREIYAVLGAVTDSSEVLVCRLVGGKVTLIHRRLWPALVRLASHFTAEQLAQVQEEHTAEGRHAKREIAFPAWVPDEVMRAAERLSEKEALSSLGRWVPSRGAAGR